MNLEIYLSLVFLLLCLFVILLYLISTSKKKRHISLYQLCLDEIQAIMDVAVILDNRFRKCISSSSKAEYSSLSYRNSVYNMLKRERISNIKENFKSKEDAISYVNKLVSRLETLDIKDGEARLRHDRVLYHLVYSFRKTSHNVIHLYNVILEEYYANYDTDTLVNLAMFIEYMIYILIIAYQKWGTAICKE